MPLQHSLHLLRFSIVTRSLSNSIQNVSRSTSILLSYQPQQQRRNSSHVSWQSGDISWSKVSRNTPVKEVLQRRFFHITRPTHKIVEFLLADIGEGIQEVIVKEWFVKEGDKVSQFDNICEVQSDKASVTITSRYDGVIAKLHYNTDDTAHVGKPLIDVEVQKDGDSMAVGVEVGEQEAIQVGKEVAEQAEVILPVARVLTTPAVRRISREYNIDLNNVQGTGKDGRIMKEDVLNYVDKGAAPAAAPVAAPQPPRPAAVTPAAAAAATTALPPSLAVVQQKDWTEPIKGFQKAMVKTMTQAMQIPHFGYCDEVDVSQLVSHKKQMQELASQYSIRFSYMPLFIKAASIALTHYPVLNASLDKDCNNITYKASHNIGLAMDTSHGLVVPNIKGVEGMTVLEVAHEINRLQELGTKGAFPAADLAQGTFSLSNIGSIGGTYAKPVILPPQVAIGAIGKIQVLPRYCPRGTVVPTSVLQVSWSADHRIIDGATMARFSNLWKKLLENPALMSLHMK